MKKILALIFAMTLLLTACGGDKETVDATKEETSTEEEASEAEAVFEPIVLIDNDQCSVTITDIDPDGTWGYTLKATLENKSSEKTYMYSVSDAYVNGVANDPFWGESVAPGKKSIENISFNNMNEIGLGEFTDIEMFFRVSDYDDWMADPILEDVFHIYPAGEDAAAKYEYVGTDADIVMIDNEFVRAILYKTVSNDTWGFTLYGYFENKSDKNVMFSVDDASVNGFMADPFWSKSVAPGRCAFSQISWGDSMLEESGIEAVENIEFSIRAYDWDDWTSSDMANEVVSLTFE